MKLKTLHKRKRRALRRKMMKRSNYFPNLIFKLPLPSVQRKQRLAANKGVAVLQGLCFRKISGIPIEWSGATTSVPLDHLIKIKEKLAIEKSSFLRQDPEFLTKHDLAVLIEMSVGREVETVDNQDGTFTHIFR